MARPNTGSVEPRTYKDGTTEYFGRILLADGFRGRTKRIPPKFCKDAETRKAWVEQAQIDEDETGAMLAQRKKKLAEIDAKRGAATLETCTQYRERLNVKQTDNGEHCAVRSAKSNWPNWIEEHLGALPISAPITVLRPKCLAILKDLNDAVRIRNKWLEERADEEEEDDDDSEKRGPGISGTTAMHVWCTLRKTFGVACLEGEDTTMHVRDDDPTAKIEPPLTTPKRAKTFLYPIEFLALIGCDKIPLCWRVLYVLLFYLYMRPSELRASKLGCIDRVADLLKVMRGYDQTRKKMKATTKTPAGVRRIPIEARAGLTLTPTDPVETLRPLLVMLMTHGNDSDLLAPLLALPYRVAPIFREHLKLAGVERRELHKSTTSTLRANRRTGRDSGITWSALLNVGGVRLAERTIKSRAGHEAWKTTEGYIKMAEDFTGGKIGVPFAALPAQFLADVEAALRAGTLYAITDPGVVIPPAAAKTERLEAVAKLRAEGRTLTEIGVALGVSKSLVGDILKQLPGVVCPRMLARAKARTERLEVVARLLAEGHTHTEIGVALGVSPSRADQIVKQLRLGQPLGQTTDAMRLSVGNSLPDDDLDSLTHDALAATHDKTRLNLPSPAAANITETSMIGPTIGPRANDQKRGPLRALTTCQSSFDAAFVQRHSETEREVGSTLNITSDNNIAAALTHVCCQASDAGRFDVVLEILDELQARRLGQSNGNRAQKVEGDAASLWWTSPTDAPRETNAGLLRYLPLFPKHAETRLLAAAGLRAYSPYLVEHGTGQALASPCRSVPS